MMKIDATDIKSLLISPRPVSKDHFVSTCFFCNKPNHFYINFNTGLWDCKKCQETGNIFRLLILLNLQDLIEYKVYAKSMDKLEALKDFNEIDEIFQVSNEDLLVPEIKIDNFKRLFFNKYLCERGFTKTDYGRFKVGKIDDFKYNGYVVIPVFEDSKTKSFISRNTLKNQNLRYKNCTDSDVSKLLFGIDELNNKTKTVILVEGFFGKKRIDDTLDLTSGDEIKCLATFGKKISKYQIIKLILKGVENIILFYDNDAVKESKKYCSLLSRFFSVKVAFLSEVGKDPDDLSSEQIIEILSCSKKPIEFNFNTLPFLKIK